jgi:FMN phosphatase YigB (HAD superfamily)
MRPGFVYLDMGNVLLRFSHQRMAEQMAAVCGRPVEAIRHILFDDGLLWAFERGELAAETFFERFCQALDVHPCREALAQAASDIFDLSVPMVGLVGKLYAAGLPLGLFSNTSPWHWQYCVRRFGVLPTMFRVHALSFELGAMKPEPTAFEKAAQLAGMPPEAIFFTDDRPDNVAAAQRAGWDAILFQSPTALHEALRQRGIRLSY